MWQGTIFSKGKTWIDMASARHWRPFYILGGMLAAAAFGWYLVSTRCSPEEFCCENSSILEFPSPAKTRRFVLFFRDCGATTGFVTNGALLGFGEPLPDRAGNVFRANGAHGPAVKVNASADLEVTWLDETHVRISHEPAVVIVARRNEVDGVAIAFEIASSGSKP